VVVTGLDNQAGSGGAAVISKAGVASLRVPTTEPDLGDRTMYALGGGGAVENYAVGEYLGRTAHAEKIALIFPDNAFGHHFVDQVTTAAKAAGVSDVNAVYVPAATTDFSAVTAQAAAGAPDAVYVIANGSQIPLVYGLLQQQGVRPDQIFNSGASLDGAVFRKAGAVVVGSHVVNEFANPTDLTDPQVRLYRDQMSASGYDGEAESMFGEWGFANVMFVADIAKKIGADKVDAASVKSYLDTTLAPGGSRIPVFLGSDLGPAPAAYPGVHRASAEIMQWDGTAFTTASPLFTPPQFAVPAP
jgi:ABC-type branched-subunit amino acid transport system substrate-binding protein